MMLKKIYKKISNGFSTLSSTLKKKIVKFTGIKVAKKGSQNLSNKFEPIKASWPVTLNGIVIQPGDLARPDSPIRIELDKRVEYSISGIQDNIQSSIAFCRQEKVIMSIKECDTTELYTGFAVAETPQGWVPITPRELPVGDVGKVFIDRLDPSREGESMNQIVENFKSFGITDAYSILNHVATLRECKLFMTLNNLDPAIIEQCNRYANLFVEYNYLIV